MHKLFITTCLIELLICLRMITKHYNGGLLYMYDNGSEIDKNINVLSMIRFKCCDKLFRDLKMFHYALIKGEALSLQAYGVVGKRNSNDIDILTHRSNLKYIEHILMQNDFNAKNKKRLDRIIMLSCSHQISPYVKKVTYGDVEVDLNFDIFWGEYNGKRIDIEQFLLDCSEVNIYGVKVKTLHPIKAMIQIL